jgi:protein-S-isoprenylcysteine O-methyltransferase Ste14
MASSQETLNRGNQLDNQRRSSKAQRTLRKKWFHKRDDLTGEHSWGDAGQIIFALLFFGVWIADSFFLRYTTQLNEVVPHLVRKPIGYALLGISAYLALSGLIVVFGKVRERPIVIRKGVFGLVRHPIYLSEVLLYLGLLMLNMSLTAGLVWIGASYFLYYLSRYEERLLLERFGEDYESYMRHVGMWMPRIRKK